MLQSLGNLGQFPLNLILRFRRVDRDTYHSRVQSDTSSRRRKSMIIERLPVSSGGEGGHGCIVSRETGRSKISRSRVRVAARVPVTSKRRRSAARLLWRIDNRTAIRGHVRHTMQMRLDLCRFRLRSRTRLLHIYYKPSSNRFRSELSGILYTIKQEISALIETYNSPIL